MNDANFAEPDASLPKRAQSSKSEAKDNEEDDRKVLEQAEAYEGTSLPGKEPLDEQDTHRMSIFSAPS
ncbi:hypothetical protein N7517_009241 [Penicillium concentricum]|uniref:Uncharacterized protein n=1 Tax=Penicillium concentricum TaxID=293559 RepID=A0A9W9RH04_9EURO|nr:uncharacterized protein N7517_009241 [Penicillium concentricum]KAJ5360050.1 hypothetical protein N7517_009241 [Penicillium concentricum]